MINHIINECSKLTQREYKTGHNWVGKEIHWELCKKMKSDHTSKWYIHKPESIRENETQRILWDFEIQTDHLILARTPDLEKICQKKKKTCCIVDFAIPVDHRVKIKENKKRDKYLDLAKELKKLCNMRVMVIPIVIGEHGTVSKYLERGLEELEIGRWTETIQTTSLLELARILRRVLKIWGDLLSLRLQWKIIS